MRVPTLILVLAALAGASCNGVRNEADAPFGPFDAMLADASTGPNADAMPPMMAGPNRVAQTGGGGVTASPGFRLRVSVGAPQPYGPTTSPDHQLVAGPNHGP